MGYLDKFKGQPLITNPKYTNNVRRINKVKNTTEEVKSGRELVKEKRKELSPEEFAKWYNKYNYQKRKEKVHQQYLAKKTLEESLAIETYHEIFDDEPPIPTYKDLEREYIEKTRGYYTSKDNKWIFYWRASSIKALPFKTMYTWYKPIRICENLAMNRTIQIGLREQHKAYDVLKNHINEISIEEFKITKKQFVTSRPHYFVTGRLEEIIKENNLISDIACEIASAMLRGVYIDSELYLGCYNFLVGDMICTSKGQLLLPYLDSNVPYLTKDSLEEIHNNTKRWLNDEKVKLPIYIMRDLYLLRIPASKFQNENDEWDSNNTYYYYVVPFRGLKNKK